MFLGQCYHVNLEKRYKYIKNTASTHVGCIYPNLIMIDSGQELI